MSGFNVMYAGHYSYTSAVNILLIYTFMYMYLLKPGVQGHVRYMYTLWSSHVLWYIHMYMYSKGI